MIGKITRKSMRARWGRNVFIGLAIMLGVSFVAGSFVLADSLRSTFDNLFSELNENVDLEVRATLTVDNIQALRDPIPASLADEVAAVDGVDIVEPSLNRFAQLLDKDGDPIETQGAPALGVSWSGPSGISGVALKDGEPPDGPGEVAIDKATASKHDYEVGDDIGIVFDSGTESFTITALVGLGNADGFGGATLAMFDPETARQVLGAGDTYDAIDMKLAAGADPATVKAAIEEILPPRTEVVTGQQVAEEAADDINSFISIFGNGLLAFAFITTFVSAFIINNVFGITISQRLRELALMRAVGASTKQVRRLIVAEALIVSVTATVLGIFVGGLGVAKGIIALFNAAGAGFPDTALQLQLRTIIVSVIVGVGVTLLSVLVPARRAAKIPPVAAMRPEIGFAALGASRRLIAGAVITVARRGAVPDRVVPEPWRHDRPDPPRRWRGVGDLPRRRQPLGHRRSPGQPPPRCTHPEGLRHAGPAGTGERLALATPHGAHRIGVDDRRRARRAPLPCSLLRCATRSGASSTNRSPPTTSSPTSRSRACRRRSRRTCHSSTCCKRCRRSVSSSAPSTATTSSSARSIRSRSRQLADLDVSAGSFDTLAGQRVDGAQGPGRRSRPPAR